MSKTTSVADLQAGDQILIEAPPYADRIETVVATVTEAGWTRIQFADGTSWTPRAASVVKVLS